MSLYVYRAQAKTFRITMSPEVSGGVLSWSVEFALRTSVYSATKLISKTVGNGVRLVSAQVIEVDLSSSDLTLDYGTYVFDVWRTDVSSPRPIVEPTTLTVIRSVNR